MSRPLRVIAYTAAGAARGGCGHRHKIEAFAARCVELDEKRCGRRGFVSDRQVEVVLAGDTLVVDGEPQWISGNAQAYAAAAARVLGLLPVGTLIGVAGGAWVVLPPEAPRPARAPRGQERLEGITP